MASVPRWKTAIENALAKNEKSTVIQISTVSTNTISNSNTARPHVRSHIFRSFLTPKSNPSLPLLLSSTDARTPKVSQILANPFVEVAWWIEGTQEQFRIFGKASIVPSPDFKPAKDATDNFYNQCIQGGVHAPPDDEYAIPIKDGENANVGLGRAYTSLSTEPGFDWEAKRVEVFKTMSAHMKASWCRPTPGTKLPEGYDDAKKWPERVEEPKVGDPDYENKLKDWNTALRNFALVLIDPLEVDYVELGVTPNRRTHFWRRVVKGDEDRGVYWEEEAVVP